MPTATAVLNFSRSDRDMLAGWSAEGSERYSRAAMFKIIFMQQAVSATFRSAELDPLAEGDDIDLLGQFLNSRNVQDDENLRAKRLTVSRTFTDVQREDPSETTGTDVILLAGDVLPDDTLRKAAALKEKLSREKQQRWNRGRSEVLGDDHKKGKNRDPSRAGAWILYIQLGQEAHQSASSIGPVLNAARGRLCGL